MNTIEIKKNLDVFPNIIEFPGEMEVNDFIDWYKENESSLENMVQKAGAVMVRGVKIFSLEDFSQVMEVMGKEFMSYVDGFSPRTKLSSNVYTSTEYDADFYITLHNELSYSNHWPAKLFFCCVIPPGEGGETPIADCREIIKNMDPELMELLETKGVRYVRNLHGGGGAGPSWQETYETDSREEVEAFCKKSKIEFYWKEDGGIKLIQHRTAVIEHPVTKEKVWFNQVDQFHPSHFDNDIYEMLMMMYDGDEEALPMFDSFGDGSKITVEQIKKIRKTVDDTSVKLPWKKGDLMIVDNVLACHGRMPYKGDRKILVSMSS